MRWLSEISGVASNRAVLSYQARWAMGVGAIVSTFLACSTADSPAQPVQAEAPVTLAVSDGGAPRDSSRSCTFGSASPHQGPPLAFENVPGTRIRPRYVVLEDGTRYLYELFDIGLDTPCSIATAADGKLRCVPPLGTFEEGFVDAACTVRAANAVASCPPTRFALDGDSYVSLTGPADKYFVKSNGCKPTTNFSLDVYAVGSPVPSTTFVEFVEQRRKLTNEIDALVKVGSDGAQLWLGDVYDAEHEVASELAGGAGDVRLLPKEKFGPICCAESETEAHCTPGFGSGPPCAGMFLTAGVHLASSWAGDAVYARGAPLKSPSLFCGTFTHMHGSPVDCKIEERSAADVYEAAPVPLDCFAAAVERPSTTGRIRPLAETPTGEPSLSTMPMAVGGVLLTTSTVKAPIGISVATRYFRDTLTNSSCAVVPMSDGTYRCAPFNYSIHDVIDYADASCTKPKVQVKSPGLTGTEAMLENHPSACPGHSFVRIFDLSDEAPASTTDYRRTVGGGCEPTGVPSNPLKQPGLEHSPSEYAAVTVTDP